MKTNSRFSFWEIKKDDEGVMWIREDHKCRIWSDNLDEVEKFLSIWVDPNDKMRFKGFKDKQIECKGIAFLKEYYGSIEAIPRDRKR